MRVSKMADMKGGWFIGSFFPTTYHTDAFEVCFKKHTKGEEWQTHYHKQATEINYLIRGQMTVNGIPLNEGDIFTIEPMEVSSPVFLTDCELIVVKTPSVQNDKYEYFQD